MTGSHRSDGVGARTARRPVQPWTWICLGATVVAGCTAAPTNDDSTGVPATFTYGCCSAEDIAQVVHPGDVLQLHWIVSPVPRSASGGPVPVTLSASLTGAYGNPEQLKKDNSAGVSSPTLASTPVRTTTQAGGAPVSRIAIPPDAAPGLYDLKAVVESAGSTVSANSIIRIEPTVGQ